MLRKFQARAKAPFCKAFASLSQPSAPKASRLRLHPEMSLSPHSATSPFSVLDHVDWLPSSLTWCWESTWGPGVC